MEFGRFMRLTNAFSKKWANLKAPVALHYANTISSRPSDATLYASDAAGVTDRLWTMSELLEAAQ